MSFVRMWNYFIVGILILMVKPYCVMADDTNLLFQTRYRVPLSSVEEKKDANHPFPFRGFGGYDSQIVYKTVKWQASQTVVCVVGNLGTRGMDTATAAYLQGARNHKLAIVRVDANREKDRQLGIDREGTRYLSGKELIPFLKQQGYKNVIILDASLDYAVGSPSRMGVSQLTDAGFTVVFVRDLSMAAETFVYGKTPSFFSWESLIAYMERQQCPTVVSTDLTGRPAFRFREDTRRHVSFIVSDDHYHAEKMLPLFAQYLTDHENLYCTVITGEGGSDFRHMEELETSDSIVVFFRRLAVPVRMKEALTRHLASGKGILGLRTSSHAFAPKKEADKGYTTWPEFDAVVQGGHYNNHGPSDLGTDVANIPGKENHPVLKGVLPEAWHSEGSLYFTKPVESDVTVLQTGSYVLPAGDKPTAPGQRRVEPLTWVRFYGAAKAPVAYSGLGYPEDFNLPVGRTLLRNLIFWTLKEAPHSVLPEVEQINDNDNHSVQEP